MWLLLTVLFFSCGLQKTEAQANTNSFTQVFTGTFFTGCTDNLGSASNSTGGARAANNICGWDDFKYYLNLAVDWLIGLGILISGVAIAYAGFNLLISDGESQRTEAKKMIWAIIKGFFFMLCAYLIVKFILNGLGVDQQTFSWLGS